MASEQRARHRSRPPELGGEERQPSLRRLSYAPSTRKPAPQRDYEVGYKKPPKDTRFKPGRSGNPRGRAKGSKNLATLVERELDSKVRLREGSKARTVSKREVVAKQLVKKAAEGHDRAILTLLKLTERLAAELDALKANDDRPISHQALAEEDRAILAALEAHVREKLLNEHELGTEQQAKSLSETHGNEEIKR